MTHSYSPSHRQLAVPGIGFPQNISVGSDVIDPAFRDWSSRIGCNMRQEPAANSRPPMTTPTPSPTYQGLPSSPVFNAT